MLQIAQLKDRSKWNVLKIQDVNTTVLTRITSFSVYSLAFQMDASVLKDKL